MHHLSAFVFDLDGTLIDSTDTLLQGLAYTLGPWGVESSEELIEQIRGSTTKEIFKSFNLSAADEAEAFKRIADFFHRHYHQVPLFPQIEDLLKEVQSHNIRMALWTARDTASAQLLLEANKIAHYFEFVVGNTGLSNNKPHPEGLQKVAALLGLSPEKMVMIGDHDHDIMAGKQFGCATARVHWAKTSIPPVVEADYNFYSVSDFLDHFKQGNCDV